MNMYIVNNGMWRMRDYITVALAAMNSGADLDHTPKAKKGLRRLIPSDKKGLAADAAEYINTITIIATSI